MFAIAIVIIVIAAGMVVLLGKINNNYTPKVGDFLKVNYSDHSTIHNVTGTTNVTYEILGVNATSIYYKVTMEGGYSSYYNNTKNGTFFDWTPSYYTGWNFTFLDSEKINTKWGAVSTDHYNVTISDGGWGDWWVCDNIVIKYDLVSSGGDVTNSYVLIDTNISQITG